MPDRTIASRVVARIRRELRIAHVDATIEPPVPLDPPPNLRRLGTPYGGWTFADRPELHGCVVISCGLGEDASFDVEFASNYGAQVVLVDPTPRAVEHFSEIQSRIGRGAEHAFVPGGKQPATAYDLSKIRQGQLELIERAVSDHSGPVRFYAPKDPAHVSHSLINFQNNYSTDSPFIEVDAITISDLFARVDRSRVQLLKMDIEGAEIGVIQQMLRVDIRPPQLCIEFDELGANTSRGRPNFQTCHRLLVAAGYRAASFDGHANFLYIEDSLY
jgi:FkbM family methyltransferase